MNTPSTEVDRAVVSSLSGLTGTQLENSERITFSSRRGTYLQPQVRGAGGGTADQLKDQLVAEAEEKLEDQSGTDISLDTDSLKSQATDALEQVRDSATALIDSTKKQVQDSIARAAAQAREEAERRLREEAENKLRDLRNRFGLPGKKGDGNK